MKVYKYPLGPVVKMPAGAAIMRVGFDHANSSLCVWALVDPAAKPRKRFFAMAKTGDELPAEIADCPHLETLSTMVQQGQEVRQLVTHVWEVPDYLVAKFKEGSGKGPKF